MNGTMWSLSGDGIPVDRRQVHVRRTDPPRTEHTVSLLAPGQGRWNLLVGPPIATAEEADRLMNTATSGTPRPVRSGEDLSP